MIIIIDSNEASKKPRRVRALQEDFEVIVDPLKCADYLFIGSEDHNPLLIESKTVIDFVKSMRDGRLVSQLKCLKDFEDKGDICLLIEGWMGLIRKKTKWNETSVSRFIESVALEWKVPIIPSPDDRWTMSWFKAKARSMGEPRDKKIYALRPSARRGHELKDQVIYLIQGFPLVGPKKAILLLTHFGTIKNIINATKEELREVIGDKTADYIIEISGHQFT